MTKSENKEIFSRNLQRYMKQFQKDRNTICQALGFKYSTFSDWYHGNKYPRIDKIELLANYFGILKSDLIEDKSNTKQFDIQMNDIQYTCYLESLNLSETDQKKILEYIQLLKSQQKTSQQQEDRL